MQIDLSHTPGVVYAFSWWLATVLYSYYLPKKRSGFFYGAASALFLAVLAAFMVITDNPPPHLFFIFMIIEISMILCFWITVTDMPLTKQIYFSARAFMLGEFAASFSWQLYYYGVVRHGFSPEAGFGFTFVGAILLAIFVLVFLLDRRFTRRSVELRVNSREVLGAVLIVIIVFIISNISFALTNTPFSARFASEIFILRTLTDIAGVGMISIYHFLLLEINARMEAEMEQQILEMQYANYQASQESIDLINQKYHDLKHQIAALRYELGDEDRFFYLKQMEKELKAYEAQNKTGNRTLDTILTAKSLTAQNAGIGMNIVADGTQLDFMDILDMSALFGNALDNAIRGASGVPKRDERLIKVVVSGKQGFVIVRVENRYEGEVRFDGENLLTTKRDRDYHGYGVKSMRSIVEKYGGSLNINTREGWFLLSILIPKKSPVA